MKHAWLLSPDYKPLPSLRKWIEEHANDTTPLAKASFDPDPYGYPDSVPPKSKAVATKEPTVDKDTFRAVAFEVGDVPSRATLIAERLGISISMCFFYLQRYKVPKAKAGNRLPKNHSGNSKELF